MRTKKQLKAFSLLFCHVIVRGIVVTFTSIGLIKFIRLNKKANEQNEFCWL